MTVTSTFLVPLVLEGGCNFRDLGGYGTADGRTVRTGCLYRSGVMAYLTEADQLALSALGIRSICDLRRADERDVEPTIWSATASILSWDDEVDATMTQQLHPSDARLAGRASMLSLYADMPKLLRSRFRGIFECLLAEGFPLVFHCAAGKDRTGVAAALILSVLGVPRETIIADYVQTNQAVDLRAFMKIHRGGLGLNQNNDALAAMPEATLQALIAAEADYLSHCLSELDATYGSVDGYVERALGVSPADQAWLREQLLEH